MYVSHIKVLKVTNCHKKLTLTNIVIIAVLTYQTLTPISVY